MTWPQALQYATSPLGAGVIAGALLSWLADCVPAYAFLAPRQKRLAFLAACLLIPTVAAACASLSGLAPLTWEHVWDALQAGIAAFAAGTVAHTRALPSGRAVAGCSGPATAHATLPCDRAVTCTADCVDERLRRYAGEG